MFSNINKILLIDNSTGSAEIVRYVLCNGDHANGSLTVEHSTHFAAGLEAAHNPQGDAIDVVLLDLALPDVPGMEALSRFHDTFPDLAVLVLIRTEDEELGLKALKIGAQNYLVKDQSYPKVLKREVALAIERKRQETALNSALRQAEEATQLKDKFVSLVAHDLRGPLGAIVGLLELMLISTKDPLTSNQSDTVKHLFTGSRSLLGVVDELLAISRLSTGQIAPKSVFFDLYYSINGAVDRLKQHLDDKGVTITNEIGPNTRVFADPMLFGQVLDNILSNAIKFCPLEGGRITISFSANHAATVTIADNGAGIAEDVIPKMFQLEEKVSVPGTAGETGTGFGMPLSANIMEAHGGKLSAESTIGEGSTFYAVLPTVRPLVLIADDEMIARDIIQLHMENIDVDVITAQNGREALSLLDQGVHPHLIISDIVMPELDGFGLLCELKSNDGTKNIPVIMVTADDKIETRERFLGLGAEDFAVKPLIVHDFIPRVRRFIG